MSTGRRVSDTDRAALEEERDFLLRSLDDLEREHDAGDIDETDYEGLRDDYTVRAATVLRSLDAHAALVTAPAGNKPPPAPTAPAAPAATLPAARNAQTIPHPSRPAPHGARAPDRTAA